MYVQGRLTQKGQVTIPAPIRKRLGLKPKGLVVVQEEAGVVQLRTVPSIRQGFGAVLVNGKAQDWDSLEEAFEQGVAKAVRAELAKEV